MFLKQEIPIPDMGYELDIRHAARLWGEGKTLCSRCEGTGNELFSMYKACEDCGGSGEANIEKKNKKENPPRREGSQRPADN